MCDQERAAGVIFQRIFWMALILLSGAWTPEAPEVTQSVTQPEVNPDIRWQAYRFRDDAFALLNADMSTPQGHVLALQYRWQQSDCLPVGMSEFPYPQFASPVMSVISTDAYVHGADTERLLGDAAMDWDDGAGLSAVAATPVWRMTNTAVEWEWPLVIRRFSDGPTFAADDAVFELRVVDGNGRAVVGELSAQARLSAAPGHLGGTFIETPARLGPYQSETEQLYFFMEPAETDNRFMAVRSTDGGRSWAEVDGAGRPRADDLEGVASVQFENTIHIIHQVSEEVFYHAFEMDSPQLAEGRWRVDSQSIAQPEEPPTQIADLVARSDGSLVTLYGGSQRLFLQIRSSSDVWGEPQELDADIAPELSGPVLAVSADDVITLAYTGRDGSGFVRHLFPDGVLSPRQLFSNNLGIDNAENGAIVPLVVEADTGATVVLYREHDSALYERRFSRSGQLSSPVQISRLSVISGAVDSEQVGADLVADGTVLHLSFIEAQSRSIHRDASGVKVYGFVYDAGSQGGSGFNRYFAIPLS
jgi:hypothetical protein